MTNDDLRFRHRLLLFAKASQLGVSRACRELGYHRSWYYCWKPRVERHGLEMRRPRERRQPRMPNQLPAWIEERIISFALGHPGLRPRRIAAQLEQPMWDGVVVSASWAWCAMALWPIAMLALNVNLLISLKHPTQGVPPPLVSGAVLIVLSVIALTLSFRRAFRRTAYPGAGTARPGRDLSPSAP